MCLPSAVLTVTVHKRFSSFRGPMPGHTLEWGADSGQHGGSPLAWGAPSPAALF